MVSFDIDYDDTLWLFAPELDEGPEAETWLDGTSGSVTESFGAAFELPGGYRELIRHDLGVWAELARRKADDYGNMLVYLPGPTSSRLRCSWGSASRWASRRTTCSRWPEPAACHRCSRRRSSMS